MRGRQKYEKLHYISRIDEVFSRTSPRQCPICEYNGFFLSYGVQNRAEARCPQCGSLERHRLIYLALMSHGECMFSGKDVLHFAPEQCLGDLFRRRANRYVTADLLRNDVDMRVNLTDIGLADNTFDLVICNEVLQYIPNDSAALGEIFRILRPLGTALITVAMIYEWKKTLEIDDIGSGEELYKYFPDKEWVRLYGRDFVLRTKNAGFATEIFRAELPQHVRHGIGFAEKMFICQKPPEN